MLKSGDRGQINNYRPILILPTLSKILEKLLNSTLVNYLENNLLLTTSQYSFRLGISTNDAVLDLTNTIVTELHSKQKVVVVFFDLAKAFDTISYYVLLLINKLERLGIQGPQLDILASYLMGRKQYIRIGI